MLARYVASRRSFRGELGIEPAETAGDADACVCDSAGGGGTCCCSSGEPDRLMPCGGCAGCCWGDWRGDAPDDAGADLSDPARGRDGIIMHARTGRG